MHNSKLFSGLIECAFSEMEEATSCDVDNRFFLAYHVRQAYALLKAAERLKYGSNDRDSCFHIVFKDKVDNNPSRLMSYALSEMERTAYHRYSKDQFVRLYHVRKVYALLKTVERLKDSGNDRDNYFHFIFNEDDDGFPEPFTENSLCFPRNGAEVRYPKNHYYDDEDEDEDEE